MPTKRSWFGISLLFVVALTISGCGSTASTGQAAQSNATASSPASTEAPAQAPSAAATEVVAPAADATSPQTQASGADDTLRLLWWQAPTILNPHLATGTKDFDASRLAYEPLASFNREGQLVAFLAAEIPSFENGGVAADGRSVTWKLKEGVTWSDGQPFSAEDVKFTYEYVVDPETAATTVASYSAVDAVEVLDPVTVKVSFKEPNPAWALPFVGSEGLILPKHIFADYIGAVSRNAPANLLPVGTGPYTVVEFKPGDVVTYQANELFREEGKPYFGRVELKGGGDAASAARAVLQTGDIDFAWNLQVEAQLLEQFATNGVGQLLLNPGGSAERIILNRTDPRTEVDGEFASLKVPHPFFTDERVRKAFALAIDRENIAKQLYRASGTAASNVLLSPANYASPNTSYEYNLEKAAALLEEAGWVDSDGDGVREKDGQCLFILFQTSVNPVRQKTQDIIKSALNQIGFEVELKSIDNSVYFSSDPANPDTFAHFYADVEMYTTGNGSPDPGSYMAEWTCAEVAQKENNWAGSNLARWCSPEYDALYEQAKLELDPEKRAQLFIQMNDLIVNDGVIIPLVHRTFPTGASLSLEGVELTPWDSNLWLIKDWKRKS
jgi:peptide/nickel transport system substrate-binding protein